MLLDQERLGDQRTLDGVNFLASAEATHTPWVCARDHISCVTPVGISILNLLVVLYPCFCDSDTKCRNQEIGESMPKSMVMSPEVMFKQLNARLLELAGVVKTYGDEELFDDLMHVIRRGYAVDILSSFPSVAVAGTQGAGKSTLVCTLYDLPRDEYLLTNPGLGEDMPVFVVEKQGINTPVRLMHELKFDHNASAVRESTEELSKNDWMQAMKNRLEGRHPLWLELQVPVRYTSNGGRGVVLLPGYKTLNEEAESSGDAWDQVLLRQALVASSAAIVVTDRQRLADNAEDLIIQDMKEHVTSPIIAIVREDEASETKKAELRTSAAAAFSVDEDNVFFTLRDSAEPWAEFLMSHIDDISSDKIARAREFKQLDGLLTELQRAERRVRVLISAGDRDFDVEQIEWKRLADTYDKSAVRKRNEFEKRVREAIGTHASSAAKKCAKKYDTEFGGNALVKFGKRLFGPGELKKDERRERFVVESWDSQALQLKLLQALSGDVQTLNGSGSGKELELSSRGTPSADARPRTHLSDSERLRLEAISNGLAPTTAKELTSTVRKMPMVLVDLVSLSAYVDQTNSDTSPAPESLTQSLNDFFVEHRTLLRTVFGLAMVDVAVDGQLDGGLASAAAMQSALVGVGLPAGAASAVLGVAAAGALLVLAQQASRAMDRRNIDEAHSAISRVSDETYRGIMENFDSVMEFGREALQKFINTATNHDHRLDRQLLASLKLSEVESLRANLQMLTNTSTRALA